MQNNAFIPVHYAFSVFEMIYPFVILFICSYYNDILWERRRDYMSHMYMTVFVRNAAYLTQLPTKAWKIRNKNRKLKFKFGFWGPLK
jgi:hypothetical protein